MYANHLQNTLIVGTEPNSSESPQMLVLVKARACFIVFVLPNSRSQHRRHAVTKATLPFKREDIFVRQNESESQESECLRPAFQLDTKDILPFH